MKTFKCLSLSLTAALVWSEATPPLAQASLWEDRRRFLHHRDPAAQDLASQITRRIPPALGYVIERFDGQPGRPLVVHLRDPHGDLVGQWHLAHMVQRVAASSPRRPLLVGVEGAWVPMDTDWLARFPDERAKRDLATALLLRGELHGEEYVALTAPPGTVRLVGVDDSTRYQRNHEVKSKIDPALRNQLHQLLTNVPSRDATWTRWIALQRKLWSLELTPPEYAEYQSLKGHLSWDEVFRHVGSSLPLPVERTALVAGTAQAERFYQLAQERDTALVEKTLTNLRATGSPVGILIAGGFHTPGITQQLRGEGISYLVIQPTLIGSPPSDPGIIIERRGGTYHEALRALVGALRGSPFLTHAALGSIAMQGLVLVGLDTQQPLPRPVLRSLSRWIQQAPFPLRLGTVTSGFPSLGAVPSGKAAIVAWVSGGQGSSLPSVVGSWRPTPSGGPTTQRPRQRVLVEHLGPLEVQPSPLLPSGLQGVRTHLAKKFGKLLGQTDPSSMSHSTLTNGIVPGVLLGLLAWLFQIVSHPGWVLLVPSHLAAPEPLVAVAAMVSPAAYHVPSPWPISRPEPALDDFKARTFEQRKVWFHQWDQWVLDQSRTLPMPEPQAIFFREESPNDTVPLTLSGVKTPRLFTIAERRKGQTIAVRLLHHMRGGHEFKGIEIFALPVNKHGPREKTLTLIRSVYFDHTTGWFADRYQSKQVPDPEGTIPVRRYPDDRGSEYVTIEYPGLPIHLGVRYTARTFRLEVDVVTQQVTNMLVPGGAKIPASVIHPLTDPHTGKLLAIYVGRDLSHPTLREVSQGRLCNVTVSKDETWQDGVVTIGGTPYRLFDKAWRGKTVDVFLQQGAWKAVPVAAGLPDVPAPAFFPKVFRDIQGRPIDAFHHYVPRVRYVEADGQFKTLENVSPNRGGLVTVMNAGIFEESLRYPYRYGSYVLERDASGNDHPILRTTHHEGTLTSPFVLTGHEDTVANIEVLPPFNRQLQVYKTFRDPASYRLRGDVKFPARFHIPEEWELWKREAPSPWLIAGLTVQERGLVGVGQRKFSTRLAKGTPVEVEYYPECPEQPLVIISQLDQWFGKVVSSVYFYGEGYQRMPRKALPSPVKAFLHWWELKRKQRWELQRTQWWELQRKQWEKTRVGQRVSPVKSNDAEVDRRLVEVDQALEAGNPDLAKDRVRRVLACQGLSQQTLDEANTKMREIASAERIAQSLARAKEAIRRAQDLHAGISGGHNDQQLEEILDAIEREVEEAGNCLQGALRNGWPWVVERVATVNADLKTLKDSIRTHRVQMILGDRARAEAFPLFPSDLVGSSGLTCSLLIFALLLVRWMIQRGASAIAGNPVQTIRVIAWDVHGPQGVEASVEPVQDISARVGQQQLQWRTIQVGT